jgi:phosphate transport system permease protein
VRKRWEKRRSREKNDTGALNHELEAERLRLKKIELRHGVDSAQWKHANDGFTALEARMQGEFEKIRGRIDRLNEENGRYAILMATADGQDKAIRLDDVVRAYPANQLSVFKKAGVYLSRWGEFLAGEPREANSEGGVFPAIFGTVVMTFLMSIVVVPFGVLAALYLREYAKAGPVVSAVRIAINNLAGVPSIVFGVFGLGFFSYIIGVRIDQLFFQAKLPSPTYGTGGILWASFTLALLTLPVVIVATEEALAAVPNSMREGSYACGASKWQTVRRIVLPRAMPGVMTGMILAMARGAGEVAPLMLVGAVKLAPELPIDGYFPYVHLERSFMHLGFHIYDLGFQSQNSEASKPMVFTTTLLLITIVFLLNLLGVILRSRLRRKFVGAAF